MFDYFTAADTDVWMDLLDVSIRSVVSIAVLFLLAKLLGNKQIKQLNFFDYVVGISIGSIAAEMATNTDTPHHFFLISMLIYTAVSLLVGQISLKSIKGRRFLEGTPIVLIERGKIIYKNLKKAQMTVNGLLSECRSLGYFDVSEIDTAILETSGELSVLPKADFKPLSAKDAGISVTNAAARQRDYRRNCDGEKLAFGEENTRLACKQVARIGHERFRRCVGNFGRGRQP